jgi:two-component system response regulator ResD
MKILLAIKEDFTRRLYSKVFQDEGFEVLESDDGKTAFSLAKEKNPDIILADVSLPEMDGFDLIKALRKEASTEKIPVMIFDRLGKEENKIKAMELEAKDFIIGILVSPPNVVLRAKMHLGEQKTYRIKVPIKDEEIKRLAQDLDYKNLMCAYCGSELILYLMRDLSKGENYFKVLFICPKCN